MCCYWGLRRKKVFYRKSKVKQEVKEREEDDRILITTHWAEGQRQNAEGAGKRAIGKAP